MFGVWPGGMRVALRIRRPCRMASAGVSNPNHKSVICKSQICRSLTPLKSSPSAPAHSARPTHLARGPGFCDFQKTLASAERGAKKVCPVELVATLHQKCKLQDVSFMIFMIYLTFRIAFFEKGDSRPQGRHNFEKRLRIPSIKNQFFDPQTASK